MKIYYKMIKRLKNLKIKTKLIGMVILISLVPMLILTIVSITNSVNTSIEKVSAIELNNLADIQRKINSKKENIELIAIRLMLDDSVQKLFANSNTTNDNQEQITEIKRQELNLQKTIFNYDYTRQLGGTNSIFLFSTNGRIYSNNQSVLADKDLKTISQLLDQTNLQKATEDFSRGAWKNPILLDGEYYIPYMRNIVDIKSSEIIGYVVLAIRESYFSSEFQRQYSYQTANYSVVSPDGFIIADDTSGNIGKIFKSIYNGELENKEYGAYEINNKLLVYKIDNNTNWIYSSFVALDDVWKSIYQIYFTSASLFILCLFICYFFALYVSSQITRPISKLVSMMSRLEIGDIDARFDSESNDEIGLLGNSFDNMVIKFNNSVKDIIRIQDEKRNAEQKALELQIDSHFLYNALSSIIWLANENRNSEVIKITKALSDFFRISISRGKEIIPVSEELTHLNSYIDIQKYRYRDQILFLLDIDNGLYDYNILKLVLQPIVENAIYHGVKSLIDSKGIIKIEGEEQDSFLVFRILDNGKSISKEQIDYINSVLNGLITADDNFGVGIKNVNDRIKTHFGNQFGLLFDKNDKYTIAEIRLPKLRKDDSNV